MISLLRTLWTVFAILVATVILGAIVIIGALFGMKDREGSLFDRIPRLWATIILKAAGVSVTVHGLDKLHGGPYVFVANHVSQFDILALVVALPRHKFVAKVELFRVPLFGQGIRALGMIPIHRTNRKAAFDAYATAAERIREGNSVVVFPKAPAA